MEFEGGGGRKVRREKNLKIVWSEFSTLSWSVSLLGELHVEQTRNNLLELKSQLRFRLENSNLSSSAQFYLQEKK